MPQLDARTVSVKSTEKKPTPPYFFGFLALVFLALALAPKKREVR